MMDTFKTSSSLSVVTIREIREFHRFKSHLKGIPLEFTGGAVMAADLPDAVKNNYKPNKVLRQLFIFIVHCVSVHRSQVKHIKD